MKLLAFGSRRPHVATSALVEQQMRRWLALQTVADRPVVQRSSIRPASLHVSVSREAGTGGEEIAQVAGEQLGWEVLDKELVDAVASHFQWPRHVLEPLDETSSSCLSGAVASWIDHTCVSQEKFVHCLANFMRAAAKRGKAVIVGRGAACVLHHYDGLKVRLVAPIAFRVERVMAAQRLDARQAWQIVEQTDRNRREFAQRYFHHDIADHRHYDLVIDVEQAGLDGAAAQIVAAAERKFRPQPLANCAG